MPLAFVGRQYLQYHNGSREAIPSSYTYANGIGFHTEDSPGPAYEPPSFIAQSPGLWARNPIPDHKMVPRHIPGELEFPAPCHDDTSGPTVGLCSGERPFHLSIVDMLQVPASIPPGDYVVGWRWDCEGEKLRPLTPYRPPFRPQTPYGPQIQCPYRPHTDPKSHTGRLCCVLFAPCTLPRSCRPVSY